MSQRWPNLSYAILGLVGVASLGCLLRWAIEAAGPSPKGITLEPSSMIGSACLALAGISFALADHWPVRIGGLGLLLGLGLIANLPSTFWLGMLLASCGLLVAVVMIRKMSPA